MTWVKLQELRFYRCNECADTGFVPRRRLRVYSHPHKRPEDLKTVIVYEPCPHCATVRRLLGRA